MKYYSCNMIESFFLNINGRIDNGDKSITLCCEPIEDKPAIAFTGSPHEILKNFVQLRANVIEESKKASKPVRKFTSGCDKCANYQMSSWQSDGMIHYVNLSMYPAPCQCKCMYCNVHDGESGKFNRSTAAEPYEKLFDMLDYVQNSGIIAPDARWQVSTGEIAIHPYKERILNLVKNQAAIFFTNCFIFDEKIAENLGANPRSMINISIDAGTPQTWFKVKGVDNFDDVTTNLVKYYKSSCRPGQITLKYIVLPEINNNYNDYLSVIEIMKILQVKHLTIARDTSIKYSIDEEHDNLLGSAAYLVAMLHKNDMTFDMFVYKPDEREQVIALANELLSSGEV